MERLIDRHTVPTMSFAVINAPMSNTFQNTDSHGASRQGYQRRMDEGMGRQPVIPRNNLLEWRFTGVVFLPPHRVALQNVITDEVSGEQPEQQSNHDLTE